MSTPAVRVFVTGGTFDKEYNLITGKLYFKDSHLNEMFNRGRCTVDVRVRTLMMLDSLEMTDSDRDLIVSNCKGAEENDIVITHGTDTMTKTASVLAAAEIDKTIVITGAMIPYQFGSSSDGFFNLGAALAFAQVLENGVYICMHGRYFEWSKVEKNLKTGFFEEI